MKDWDENWRQKSGRLCSQTEKEGQQKKRCYRGEFWRKGHRPRTREPQQGVAAAVDKGQLSSGGRRRETRRTEGGM